MGGRLAPDPGEVGDAGVGEDQAQPGMARADLDGVAAERRDAAAGVAEDREAVLVGEGEHVLEVGMVEVEALGARVELDPACARCRGSGAPRRAARRCGSSRQNANRRPSLAAASAATTSLAAG